MTDKTQPKTEAKAEAKQPKKMVIDKERRATYTKAEAKTAAGNRVIDTGDVIATALRAVSKDGVDAIIAVARENGEEVLNRVEGYVRNKLNNGQIRMNFGNILRAKYNKGEPVKINGKVYHDKEAKARIEAEAAKQKAAKKVVTNKAK